jgi:hypothetical protein
MCTITYYEDLEESECSNCKMRFTVFSNRSPIFVMYEHCPVCGDAVENYVTVQD